MTDVQRAWDAALASLGGSRIEETGSAWSTAFDFLTSDSGNGQPPAQHVVDAFLHLKDLKQTDAVLSQFLDWLHTRESQIRAIVEEYPQKWRETQDIGHIVQLLDELSQLYSKWLQPLLSFGAGRTEQHAYSQRFQLIFFTTLPVDFGPALNQIFANVLGDAGGKESETLLLNLLRLGIIQRFKPILHRLIYSQIESKINLECANQWATPELARILEWLQEEVCPRLRLVLKDPQTQNASLEKEMKMVMVRSEHQVHTVLCGLRISELFDIIVDYPDSLPALADLSTCLDRTDARPFLAQSLRQATAKRLLHPGADTKDIIAQYVSTIRCLRIVDPSGVLLSRVAQPLRAYLRSRDDTIRCIMTSLTDEEGDLMNELEQSGENEIARRRKEAEDYSDPNWQPDPIDAPPDFHLSRSGDVIEILVSIYDTTDVFIQEFQVLLAQSLLEIKDYNAARQVRNVEILKKRFGENALAACEVMLKDLADSKRVDQNIHGLTEMNPMHPTIVSHLFWPALQSSRLRLPQHLSALQQSYQQAFVTFKPDKYLRWMPHLGTLDVEIELDDRTLNLQVTPIQAAVTELFQDQSVWTLDELAERLTVPKDVATVKNAVFFWANHGVLREDPSNQQWFLMDAIDPAETGLPQHPVMETESIESLPSEEMREYWQFIVSMLNNLGALPVDRMHTMLARTVPQYKGKTLENLKTFLKMAQEEGALIQQRDSKWKLA